MVDAQAAANMLAGTSGLELQGALNVLLAKGGTGGSSKPSGSGAVVLTVDDGYSEQYDLAAKVEAAGGRMTLYVNGNYDSPGRLTSAQILDLDRRGHEIGWHGESHLDMTSLTTTARGPEWDGVTDLETLLGHQVRHFAYPFGFHSATTDAEAVGRFDSIRGTGGLLAANRYFLSEERPYFWYGFDWGAQDNHNYALELVKIAAASPEIVTPYFHKPDLTANPTTAQVQQLLDLCKSLGVPLVTVSQAFGGRGSAVINPDFTLGTTTQGFPTGWFLATGGTPTMAVVNDAAIPGLFGTNALKISLPAATGHFGYVQQIFPVKPGHSYTCTALAQVSAASGPRANVRINWRDAQGNSVAGGAAGADYVGTTWGKVSQTLTAPAGAVQAKVDLMAQTLATGATVGGDVWFRHVWFGEAGFGAFSS